MTGSIVNVVEGVILGLLTGYATGLFFERRANKATRAQNEAFIRRFGSLDDAVNNIIPGAEVGPGESSESLIDLVAQRARNTLDGEGRVSKGDLVGYFVGKGHHATDVNEAIDQWCSTGAAQPAGRTLVVK
jgi:hypothetical protein